MKPLFQVAKNKDFAERLTRQNMQAYYQQLGILWDQAAFDINWHEFENYEIAVNRCPVGMLRISHDELAYYIRDLQIEPTWQGQGLGSQALSYAIELARKADVRLLRLCVFETNPALALYQRKGFRICKTERYVHYMARELN
ncbi:GNAT family N-acetyltransferase [Agarivorans sp. Z349TD_8]|uniref:GNAT family N-acetyltransferase n=1 Tax=Agarivorans sp. Z349TD_8 TaxID=3421434 RepID=UPI003D7C67BE